MTTCLPWPNNARSTIHQHKLDERHALAWGHSALRRSQNSNNKMPAYGEAEYWDHRYQAEPVFFDWYMAYEGLEPVLKQHVAVDANILQLGVGTSLLQAQMVQKGGYQRILSLDISSVAVKHMQEVHSHIPQLTYKVADARSLPQHKDCSFDVVLDKGTLDSLMCGEHAGDDSSNMLEECHRVLKEGGVLINITYGEPSARVPFLQRLHFDVAFYMLTKAQELAAGAGVQGAPVGSNGGITVHGPVDAHTQPFLDVYVHSPTTYYVYVATKPRTGRQAQNIISAASSSEGSH